MPRTSKRPAPQTREVTIRAVSSTDASNASWYVWLSEADGGDTLVLYLKLTTEAARSMDGRRARIVVRPRQRRMARITELQLLGTS